MLKQDACGGARCLAKRMLSLLLPVVVLLSSHRAVAAVPDGFRSAEASVLVRNAAGKAISGAFVYALSRDWKIRFPISAMGNPGLAITDQQGRATLRLPLGRYTFCAFPSWRDLLATPGHGFFLVQADREIREQTEVALTPDAEVVVTSDLTTAPDLATGWLRAYPAGELAGATQHSCAHAADGKVTLATNRGAVLDLAFHSLHRAKQPVGRFLGRRVRAPTAWHTDVPPAQLSTVDLEVTGPDGDAGKANIIFAHGKLGNYEGAILAGIRGRKRLLVMPGYVSIRHCELWHDERVSTICGQDWIAHAGDRRELRFGGPLRPMRIAFFTREGRDATEYCIFQRDAFGNLLLHSPHTTSHWSLTQHGESLPVEAKGLGLHGFFPKVFPREGRPMFRLELNLGAYGVQKPVEGIFDDDAFRYKESLLRLPHIDLYRPDDLPERREAITGLIQRSYDTYARLVGTGPERFRVTLSLWGVAGGGTVDTIGAQNVFGMMNLGSVGIACGEQQIALHEMGHGFCSSFAPHRAPWYHGPLIIESWPTVLALEAIREWHGDYVGDYAQGRQCSYVLANLGNREGIAALHPMRRHQFVEVQIRRRYGWRAMRRFFRLSYLADDSAPASLKAAGLTRTEAVAALYSHVCGENLGWLFRAMAFDVKDERIALGIQTLQHQAGLANQAGEKVPTQKVEEGLALPDAEVSRVVRNSGFERPGAAGSSLDQWSVHPRATTGVSVDSSGVHGGRRSLRLESTPKSPEASLRQVISDRLLPGRRYRVGVWIKGKRYGVPASVRIALMPSWKFLLRLGAGRNNTKAMDAKWRHFTGEFSVPVDHRGTIEVIASTYAKQGTVAWIDDLTIDLIDE